VDVSRAGSTTTISTVGGSRFGFDTVVGGTRSSVAGGGVSSQLQPTERGGYSGNTGSAKGGVPTTGGTASGGSFASSVAGRTAQNGGSSGAVAATTAGGTGVAGSAAKPSCSGSGWNLVWSDEFNAETGMGVDANNWTFDLGSENNGWGNNELEYYTSAPKNVSMDGAGNLVITAIKEAQGGKQYTSARIKTQGLKTWRYGRIESRMQLPKGQGIWPAFWMLGADIASNAWPNCGEIDIMENVGKEPNVVHGSLHGPGYSGGNALTGQVSLNEPVGNAFHLFAVEWDATSIRWFVDDTLYSTKKNTDVPSGATWVYTHEFFIILNVAVGGTWPGAPDDKIFPQKLSVDYVRVCQK
jgi:beta-glucanase (GH16 family)